MTDQLRPETQTYTENGKVKKLDFRNICSSAFIWLCSDDETARLHSETALRSTAMTTKKYKALPTFDPDFPPPGQLQTYPEIKILDISVCLMVVPSGMWSTVESEIKKLRHQTKITVILSFDDKDMFIPTESIPNVYVAISHLGKMEWPNYMEGFSTKFDMFFPEDFRDDYDEEDVLCKKLSTEVMEHVRNFVQTKNKLPGFILGHCCRIAADLGTLNWKNGFYLPDFSFKKGYLCNSQARFCERSCFSMSKIDTVCLEGGFSNFLSGLMLSSLVSIIGSLYSKRSDKPTYVMTPDFWKLPCCFEENLCFGDVRGFTD